MTTARDLGRQPVHPLLIATYAVLLVYGGNLGEVSPGDAVLPIVAAVGGTGMALLGLALALRDRVTAGLVTSALAILFFSYGHVLAAIESTLVTSGRLLLVWLVLMVLAGLAVWRWRRSLASVTPHLNLLGAIFVGVALVPIVIGEIGAGGVAGQGVGGPSPAPSAGEGSPGPDRDIYVIVVEDIGSERILREQWGMQGESPFAFLDELGFARVPDAHSNYGKTGHSLASMFNLDYLDGVAARMGPDSGDFGPVYDLLDDHAAGRFLKERGYEYVHIGAWWDPTARSSIADVNLGLETPSDFATAFLETTMLPAITSRLSRIGIRIGVAGLEPHELQYQSAVTGFAALETTLDRPGPTFVFAHFLVPHDPYVFDLDGSFLDEDERADRSRERLFLDQARYTMTRVESFVAEALAGPPDADPIIIVTTDEGPNPLAYERHPETYDWTAASDEDLREKFEIELALYLPDREPADAGFHDGMTLVNAFRGIFDAYFGTAYGSLPDRSFVYPDKAHPYRLTDITERLSR